MTFHGWIPRPILSIDISLYSLSILPHSPCPHESLPVVITACLIPHGPSASNLQSLSLSICIFPPSLSYSFQTMPSYSTTVIAVQFVCSFGLHQLISISQTCFLCDKMPYINSLRRRMIYFGSHLQRFQSIVLSSVDSGFTVRQNIMEVEACVRG